MSRTIDDRSSYGPGYIWGLSGRAHSSANPNSYPNPNAGLNTTNKCIPDTAHRSYSDSNYTASRHIRCRNCSILRAGTTCCAAKCFADL
jgi:hypothetical protein